MKLLDSRRLTGPNPLLDGEGAVLDVALAAKEAHRAIATWRVQARRILESVGWGGEALSVRRFPDGASLALSAPPDALYAATEVNEWAWTATETILLGLPEPDLAAATARLREEIERESNPALLTLRAAARLRGVSCLADPEQVSLGLGTGSRTWPVREIPDPSAIDWSRIHDIPVYLVTGTNGKTTTVRLLTAMLRQAGRQAGSTSTDRIEVGGVEIDRGDYSGPGGARTLLRDPRVAVAVLETARGGILRRGLAVRTAAAALVTNIAADHLGEFGVHDLESLATAKLVVARVIRPGGRLVLNADDPLLRSRASLAPVPVVWFGLAEPPGDEAAFLQDGRLMVRRQGRTQPIAAVEEVPITFGGAARHNVANALAATALAATAGVPAAEIAAALRGFRSDPESNPGRANLLAAGGVRILLDYAHNPHGIAALLELASSLPAGRRLVLLGQAGDRDDDAIRELARTVWSVRPDHVVIKELPEMLRGREPGEVPAILERELRRLGAEARQITRAASELEGVRAALAWAHPEDLLILLVHTQRGAVLELLRSFH